MSTTSASKLVLYAQQGATFIFLVYVLFLLGRSAWQNVETNRKMEALRAEIAELRAANQDLGYMILYEKTAEFREIEARKNLLIQKPGELAIRLPANSFSETPKADETPKTRPATTDEILTAWLEYYTKN